MYKFVRIKAKVFQFQKKNSRKLLNFFEQLKIPIKTGHLNSIGTMHCLQFYL